MAERSDRDRILWIADNLNHLVKRKGGYVNLLHPDVIWDDLGKLADAAMHAEEKEDAD